MTQNSFNILTSRRNQITKTEDVLDLNGTLAIKQVTDKTGEVVFNGGLEYMGEFDEGACFKLKLKTGLTYIICSVNKGKINSLMDYIWRGFKAKMEERKGIFDNEVKMDTNFSIDNKNFDMAQYVKDQLSGKKKDEEPDLGDWGVCDHVCGGGIAVKYKSGCTPAVGGYECKRPPVKLKKACNTQPCKEGDNKGKLNVPDEEWKFKQPTITLPTSLDSR